ncbi:caspase family protein [Escherichia coli]|nr:caspase family protein [Escherichia coli]
MMLQKWQKHYLDTPMGGLISRLEHLHTVVQPPSTKISLNMKFRIFFSGECDVALFYFAGHGYFDNNIDEGMLIPHDFSPRSSNGIRISDVMVWANKATNIRNKIIILDCCQAGAAGQERMLKGGETVLADGSTILTACRRDEYAKEVNDGGVFTSLMVEALYGAGANILGYITPSSLYSFVDQALGAWDQRPVFKTNVSRFVVLREVGPRVSLDTLRKLPVWFPTATHVFHLDPSFEPTSESPIDENVSIFQNLQKCNRHGLVELG